MKRVFLVCINGIFPQCGETYAEFSRDTAFEASACMKYFDRLSHKQTRLPLDAREKGSEN